MLRLIHCVMRAIALQLNENCDLSAVFNVNAGTVESKVCYLDESQRWFCDMVAFSV
jgi:hypothetical protein